MPDHKHLYRTGLVALLAISLFVCTLTAGVYAQGPARQISFTPNIPPLEMTRTAEATQMEAIGPLGQLPPPVMATAESGEYPLCGLLRTGPYVLPIGDAFTDASAIPLGATIDADPFGHNGYAEIMDQPDYRLLWVTLDDGTTQYIIVHRNDPLFSDEFVGFVAQVEAVQDGIRQQVVAGVPALTAAGGLVVIGISGCPVTAGGGCAFAAGSAIVGAVVSSAAQWWVRLTVVDPALENLERKLEVIDLNRGSPLPCTDQQQ